jgi:hypothetical protein
MNELAQPKLKRKMDPAAMGNDVAMLRQLTAQLNDPRLTGAAVPPDEQPASVVPAPIPSEQPPPGMTPEAAMRLKQQMIMQQVAASSAIPGPLSPQEKRDAAPKIAVAVKPAPPAVHAPAQTLFFTGHPFSGKKWLAEKIKARVFGFDDPIRNMASEVFGDVEESALAGFIATVRAFGEGDAKVPLSVARALFIDHMREGGPDGDKLMGVPVSEFGTPAFWTRSLLARIARYHNDQPNDRVVVLDLSTIEQYSALRDAGFKPYHIVCHDATRSARAAGATAADNQLATIIGQNIIKDLSQNPGGKKLWCVWNDTEKPCPSGRLMALQEFLSAYK